MSRAENDDFSLDMVFDRKTVKWIAVEAFGYKVHSRVSLARGAIHINLAINHYAQKFCGRW